MEVNVFVFIVIQYPTYIHTHPVVGQVQLMQHSLNFVACLFYY